MERERNLDATEDECNARGAPPSLPACLSVRPCPPSRGSCPSRRPELRAPGEQDMVVAMVRPVGVGGSGGAPKGGMNIFAEYLITSRPFRSRARPPSASATRPSASGDPPAIAAISPPSPSSSFALCRCRTSFRRLSRDDDDDEDDRMNPFSFVGRPSARVRPLGICSECHEGGTSLPPFLPLLLLPSSTLPSPRGFVGPFLPPPFRLPECVCLSSILPIRTSGRAGGVPIRRSSLRNSSPTRASVVCKRLLRSPFAADATAACGG